MTDELLARAEAAFRFAIADPVSAASVAADVVRDARGVGAVEPLVVGLRAVAWSAFRTLAGDQAKQVLDEAARLARSAHLDVRLGQVLVSRAAVNLELGRSRSALRDLDSARPLLGGAAAPPELAFLSAVVLQNAGRLHDAAVIYRRVLADQACQPETRAKTTNNLGLIEAQFGHYGPAMALLREAQELARDVAPALYAYFAESRALVTANAGRLPASLVLFEEAERLYEMAGLPPAELFFDHAEAMADLRLLPEAVDSARRAADQFGASGADLMRAESELRTARLALLTGDLDEAATLGTAVEQAFRRQGRAGWAARAVAVAVEARAQAGTADAADLRRVRRAAATLERLQLTADAVEAHITAARVAGEHGRDDWAMASLGRAHRLAKDGPMLLRLKGRLAAASAAARAVDHRRTLQHCRAGLRDLNRHRAALASTELRVRASAHGAELGHIALRSVVESGSPRDVFAWMERTRAAALVVVQRSRVPGAEEELAALRSVQAEMDAAGAVSPALVARHAGLEQHLRRATWADTSGLPAASAWKPHPVSEVREHLDGRVLVEYGVVGKDVVAVVVGPTRIRLVRLGSLDAVLHEVDGLYFVLRLLSRPARSATAPALRDVAEQRLARLRALLLEPLGLAAADRELVVVPTGELQRVPWCALHDGPVSVAPSASFWLRARQRAESSEADVLLVAGPGLQAVDEEVRGVAAVHDRGTVLRGQDSTVNRVAESLRTAGLVHFACHGQVRSDNPMFSGLQLTDGPLTVQELELRDIAPHRIVLAACEAAADVAYPGGEMLGFVSALLARGTAGMVASLILVPDAATTSLMIALHEHIRRGETLAVALHAARSTIDREDPHGLVNWCGFAAFGAA